MGELMKTIVFDDVCIPLPSQTSGLLHNVGQRSGMNRRLFDDVRLTKVTFPVPYDLDPIMEKSVYNAMAIERIIVWR